MKRFIAVAAIIVGMMLIVGSWIQSTPVINPGAFKLSSKGTIAVLGCVPVGQDNLLIEGQTTERKDWLTRIKHRWLPLTAGTLSGLLLLGGAGYLIRLSGKNESETDEKLKGGP